MCVVAAATIVSIAAAQDKLSKKYVETITAKDGTKYTIDMALVPGGEFTMGSPGGEADRGDNEGPQCKVRLDPYYLCTTETTLELFMVYYHENRHSQEGVRRGAGSPEG